MRLRISGQAVGPQLSIDNHALRTEGAFYSRMGWLINAIVVHRADGSSDAPAKGTAGGGAPGTRAAATAGAAAAVAVRTWAAIGPFNDTNATGLFRSVGACDAADHAAAPDYDLSHTHAGKGGKVVAWTAAAAGPGGSKALGVAAAVGDDAKGSAALLQTSVFCSAAALVRINASTSGTGKVSVEGLGTVAVDEVYAGLFESEVSAVAKFQAGWSYLQVKTLSHFSSAAGWEAQLTVTAVSPGVECHVDVCGDPRSLAWARQQTICPHGGRAVAPM